MPKSKSDASKSDVGRKAAKRRLASADQPQRKVKEIAGVKVPKDLRDVAAAAQKLMENPLVREVVTAGVLAAIAALAEAQQESRELKAQRASGGPAGDEARRNAKAKSTAKVIATAAAGAMGKRIVSEVTTRGPELLAKLEGAAKSRGTGSAGEKLSAGSAS
jgi:hypothetical protein